MSLVQVGSWKYVVNLTKRTYEKDMIFVARLSKDYVKKSYIVEDGKYLIVLEPVDLYNSADFSSHINNISTQVY